MLFNALNSRQYHESHIPGFRTSPLWGENGDGAYFAEFKQGVTFPLHDHDDTEQIYLVSGHMRFGAVEMLPGDFLKVVHGDAHTGFALADSVIFVTHTGGLIMQE